MTELMNKEEDEILKNLSNDFSFKHEDDKG